MIPDDELISAYLDDELSADERRRAEELLVDRADLRRLFDELRSLREGLKGLPSYRLEPEFGAGVLRRAEREVLRGRDASNGAPPAESRASAPVEVAAEVAAPAASPPLHPAEAVSRHRPILWSIVAVAAAVVLMFLEQRRVADDRLARAPDPDVPAAGEAARRERSATESLAAGRPEANDKRADDDRSEGRNVLGERAAGESGNFAKHKKEGGAGEGMTVAGKRDVAGVETPAAKQGTAPVAGGAMSATNGIAATRSNAPSSTSAAAERSLIRTDDLERSSAIVTVAQTDQRRARQLVSNYQTLQMSQQVVAQQSKTQEALQRGQAERSENVLVVTCEVDSPEALERSFLPVLRFNHIADVSEAAVQSGAKPSDSTTEDEAFYYVVADGAQLESTLAALRSDRRHYLNVVIEPAPQNLRQQAWRSFNRSEDAAALERLKDAQLSVSNALNLPPASAPAAGATFGASATPRPAGTTDGYGLPSAAVAPSTPQPSSPVSGAAPHALPTVSPYTLAPTPKDASGPPSAKNGAGSLAPSAANAFRNPASVSGDALRTTPNFTLTPNLNAGGLAGSLPDADLPQLQAGLNVVPMSRAQRLDPEPLEPEMVVPRPETVGRSTAGRDVALPSRGTVAPMPVPPPAPAAAASVSQAAPSQVAAQPAAAAKPAAAPRPAEEKSLDERRLAKSSVAAASQPGQTVLQTAPPPAGDYHEALFIFRFRNRAGSGALGSQRALDAATSSAPAETKPAATAPAGTPAQPGAVPPSPTKKSE